MPRKARELTALEVRRLTEPGLHHVGTVAGLALRVAPSGARSWVLRAMVGERRRDIGLGGFPDVSLADAIAKAREARDLIGKGADPVETKRAARADLIARQARALTFKTVAADYIAAHAPRWRNAKHAAQWRSTLETYAYPIIGAKHVADITTDDVLAVLRPIWPTKPETASRVRGRIEHVLDAASSRGSRNGPNPARWRGHLDKLLAQRQRAAHHPALGIDAVPPFVAELRKHEGIAARALEFLILTAARSGEVRGATWAEIDTAAAVWTIPAERMKAGREHRVPLAPAALELLAKLPRLAGVACVFPAVRGGMLSDMTLLAVMRRLGAQAVPHGFRSSFRDWASERTSYPPHAAEQALAHTIGDKVEAAYRRGDLFEKRSRMMEDWAAFLSIEEPAAAVIPMNRRSR